MDHQSLLMFHQNGIQWLYVSFPRQKRGFYRRFWDSVLGWLSITTLRILTPQKWLFWGPWPLLYRFKPCHWRVQGFLLKKLQSEVSTSTGSRIVRQNKHTEPICLAKQTLQLCWACILLVFSSDACFGNYPPPNSGMFFPTKRCNKILVENPVGCWVFSSNHLRFRFRQGWRPRQTHKTSYDMSNEKSLGCLGGFVGDWLSYPVIMWRFLVDHL